MKRDERAVLMERRSLSPEAFLLTFESPYLASVLVPGQLTMLRIPDSPLLLRRPYSFCGAEPESNLFSLLVKVVGAGTRALADLSPGRVVNCLGPLGTFFTLPRPGVRPVIVAGGVGIAPFLGFCQVLARKGLAGSVLLGGRKTHDLYLRQDFEQLGMKVICATEDGSYGRAGLVTDLLPEELDAPDALQIYSCGPSGMLARVAALARERNIPHETSIERRMGCGMGCCLGCVVFTRKRGEENGEYRRTCTEGPVFDAGEICWERDLHPL